MGIKKKLVAMALVAAMAVTSAFSVSAATSPANGNFDTKTEVDDNKQDHDQKTVSTKVTKKAATVLKVESTKKASKGVNINVARDASNKKVNITTIGDGKKGVFASKKGQYVTSVKVKSKAKKVTIKANAFKSSKIKKLTVTSKKVQINKNAFKGTKAKSLTLNVKKASQLTLKKGAFTGLKKITIKGANKSQKAKIKKALKKAGFKGTIK